MKKKTQICRLSYLQSFTAKNFFIIFSCCLNQLALAQVKDDFSDSDFVSVPPWTGDDSKFTVNDGRLQLNALAEDGSGYLSTESSLAVNALWEFKVALGFNPSASNYARIYLTSDQQNLTGPLNGYFVMVGGSSDEVSLYKQTGRDYAKIIDGKNEVVNLQSVDIIIKVTRNENTGWQLFTRTTDMYTLEGSSLDTTFSESSYVGVLCTYTATRSDKFFFDDFQVSDDTAPDSIPPGVENVEAKTSRELRLTFSEPLSETSMALENFSVNNGVGKPVKAIFDEQNRVIVLDFETDFPSHERLIVSISGVSDEANNLMAPVVWDFIFSPLSSANFKDLIITEIFADPIPAVGLPSFEFVEVFNRSDRAFNVRGWTLTDGSSTTTLPDLTLLPTEYCVLTGDGTNFPDAKAMLVLENFPSLNNTHDVIVLADESGVKIDSVQYFPTWYKDDDKADGGWSLEIIDPNNICSAADNWTASEDASGGTPGYQNSVFANKPDVKGPKLEAVVALTATEIHLQFNEKLEKILPLVGSINITPSISPTKVSFADATLTSLSLSLQNQLQSSITYTLTVSDIYDCAGNVAEHEFSSQQFGLPEKADSLDLLVNEILFNPRPTGIDFVEIINASSKFINLQNWSIASLEGGIVKNKSVIASKDLVVAPKGLLVFTEDAEVLKGEYLLSNEETFLEVKDMPSFNDDEGTVVLLDPEGVIIDLFSYTKEMHSIYLKDDEGVSLERISVDVFNNSENWKSGSANVGFATPGYLNSNAVESASLLNPITVDPEIFHPLSSNQSFALVHYNFEHGGYIANVKIFDSQGHVIKHISNNDILGTSGFYRWDGDRDNGTKANVGYYMIWFEIFDAHGSIKNFRSRVAIATSF